MEGAGGSNPPQSTYCDNDNQFLKFAVDEDSPNSYKVTLPKTHMQLWKIAAFVVLVICVGHLIFIFYESEPDKIESLKNEPVRRVMLEADYFPILCDILIVVVIVSGLATGLKRRKKPKFPAGEEENWLMLMLMRIGALSLLGVFYVLILRKGLEGKGVFRVLRGIQQLSEPAPGSEFYYAEPNSFEQYMVILLSLVIIIIIAILVITLFKPKESLEEPILIALPDILMRRKAFIFDGNSRDVVINAYGAALEELHKKGFNIPEHFTPREFQQQVNSPHLDQLTHLFVKARYSTHNITPHDSEEALRQYRILREAEFDIPHQPPDQSEDNL